MSRRPTYITNTVKASHLILTGYGHWLPNDIRGSGSTEIRKPTLEELGPIHFGRKRDQPARPELRAFFLAAEPRLDHPTIWFDAPHRQVLARAVERVILDRGYTVYACAMLRNHLHLVVRTHRDNSFTMACHLAEASYNALHAAQLVPADHPVWAQRAYKVYLKTPLEIRTRIDYVKDNPRKEGLPPQEYAFVQPYDRA